MRKWQRYEIINDYVIIYTSKNEPFYVDLVDFDKVYRYSWYKDKDGYLIAKINKKSIKLHRYITDCPPNMIVDHIGGALTRNDNRRKNLRITTQQLNTKNHTLLSNNTSGYNGVSFDKKASKWRVYIYINGKQKTVGRFTNIEDALLARKEAEIEYYGEYAYDYSQKLYSTFAIT